MIGTGPAGTVVEHALLKVIIERPLRLTPMPRNRSGAPLVALLEPSDTTEIAADAPGEMGELDLQCRQLVQKPAVDDADGRNHQRELPTQHATEIIRIHPPPAHHLRQRMHEHITPDIRP